MTKNVINGVTVLTADEGKTLVKDDIYTSTVHLGKNDSVENWQEVGASEVPSDLTAEEKLVQIEEVYDDV